MTHQPARMIKSSEEFFQILAKAGISTYASEKEQILNVIRKIEASPEVIEKQECHESQENLEPSFDHFFQPEGENDESYILWNGEPTLEPEIEEFLISLSEDPLCVQKNNHSKEDNLHDMVEEDIQISVDEQVNQGCQDYIEIWFQTTIKTQQSLLQQFLTSHPSKLLVSHIMVCFKTHFSNRNVSIFLILLRTWLHWKYSYT